MMMSNVVGNSPTTPTDTKIISYSAAPSTLILLQLSANAAP